MPQATQQLPPDIQSSLAQVNEAAGNFSGLYSEKHANTNGIKGGGLRAAKYDLFLKTSKLVQTVQGPMETLWSHMYQLSLLGALAALIEIGVFDKLPSDGTSMKATDLSKQLNVDKDLLVRLMRSATVLGPFAETGPEEYAHTPYSLIYNNRELRSAFKVAYVSSNHYISFRKEFPYAGLRLETIYRAPGSAFCVIEAWLK